MKYGVSIRMPAGTFAGCRLAIIASYGVPLLFDEHEQAAHYVEMYCQHKPDEYCPEIVPERLALAMVKQVVEVASGRRKVSSGNMPVVDETRATYERCMELSRSGLDAHQRGKDDARAKLYRDRLWRRRQPKAELPEMME